MPPRKGSVTIDLPTEEAYINGEYSKPHYRARSLTARCEKEIFDAVKEAAFQQRVSMSALVRVCMQQIAEQILGIKIVISAETVRPSSMTNVQPTTTPNDGGKKDDEP